MNLILKCLAALALVAVTLAATSVAIRFAHDPEPGDHPSSAMTLSPAAESTKPEPLLAEVKSPVISHAIDIPRDDPLQPSYRPINQPAALKFLRQEGKRYHNVVAGKLSGQASKKDWGIVGVAHFEYIYTVDSTATVVKNDGTKIVEERAFGHVNENLLTSAYELRVELPESLQTLCTTLSSWGTLVGGDVGEAMLAAGTLGESVRQTLDHVQLNVSKETIEAARKSGLLKNFPALDPSTYERDIKMFTQSDSNRLLEGKVVRVTFLDGYGVSVIEPVGCVLSEPERDVIVRTNFIVDHYLFPDDAISTGDEWVLKGSVFGGFIDPRLPGRVSGEVKAKRVPDFVDASGKSFKRVKVTDGALAIDENRGGWQVVGNISSLHGVAVLSDEVGVVTAAHFHGSAEYNKIRRPHLLFQASMSVTPMFEVRYECTVE